MLTLLALAPPPAASDAPAAPLEAPASDAPWARALVAALPRATEVNDRDGNKVFDDLDRAFLEAAPGERLPVIVSFVQGVESGEGVARVRALAPDAPVARAFRVVPAYAGALSLDEALRVARLPEVRQIERDAPAEPELETATRFMGADAVVDEMGVTGSLDGDADNATTQDVVIAVLDTGFHVEHEDLAGKLVHWIDLADGKKEPYDDNGHGTHVASIAAGWGRAKPEHRGVAPGAGVVGMRIGSASDAIAGYEWIAENHRAFNVRVATMSFGFGLATDGTTALERAVDAAWDAGVVNFKSNGNSGPDRGTMTVPAAARGILGVGSMLDPGGQNGARGILPGSFGFHLSGYSSRGPTTDGRVKPDLVAPGQAITAAQSGTKDGYVAFSGTSMAAPFAAGAAALVLAANPALAPDAVRDVLTTTAEDWGLEGPDVDYGHGRLRVDLAVQEAFRRAGATPPPSQPVPHPFHEVRAGVVGTGPYEGSFRVNDTTHPIAATFIAEGTLLAVDVLGPDDAVLARPGVAPARQQVVAFQPTTAGTYAFRVVAAPGTAFVADFSHGTATSLLDEVVARVGENGLPEGVAPAATLEDAPVPGPGAALAVGVVGAVALALASRRRSGGGGEE